MALIPLIRNLIPNVVKHNLEFVEKFNIVM